MRALLLFCLLGLVTARDQVRCPIPHYHQLKINEDLCSEYSACEWLNDFCFLKSSGEYGYTSRQDGNTYTLTRNSQLTLFGNDIEELRAELFFYDDNHLRVKISDLNNERFEVPVPLNLPETSSSLPDNAQYQVQVTTGHIFDFKIIRTSTQTVLFDTSKVSAFVYDDQFLQIGASLPSTYVYGFGENVHESFRHPFDGETYVAFSKDQPPDQPGVNLYGTHPVYHCMEDDEGNSHGVFIFNANAMEYSFRNLSDGSPSLLYNTVGGILDIHFFLGPSIEDINKQYTQVIGRTMMPPYWSLGFQLSRYGYNNLETMQEALNLTREENIPQDVQYLDIDYFEGRKDFTYDAVNFPGLPEYLRYLKTTGVRFVTILDPALVIIFDDSYPPSKRGKAKDVFIKWPTSESVPEDQPEDALDYMVGYVWPDNKTVFPDFFYKPTEDWWIQENAIFHETIAFDGLWVDMNEPANFGTNEDKPFNWPAGMEPWSLKCSGNKYDEPPYPTKLITVGGSPSRTFPEKTLCMIGKQRMGTAENHKTYRHYDVHSLYGWSQVEPSYKANLASTGERPLIVTRSTYPGSGKYCGHWLGDNFSAWNNLKRSIIGMLEFNMFGIPYVGADICGFFEQATEELCSRWMSLGAFYPFARNHNGLGNIPQDPGRWPTTAEASRVALGARYTMLPYLYTLFAHSHMEGSSVIRPLLSDNPTDLNARDIDDVFMWGSYVLIAPMLDEGLDIRVLYIPAGRWFFYSSKTIAAEGAGNFYFLPLDITEVGIFLKGGGIIPTKKSELTTDASRNNSFEMLVALDENDRAAGDVFWDDGVTEGSIEKGIYYYSTMSFAENVFDLYAEKPLGDLAEELLLSKVTVMAFKQQPQEVTVNGATVQFYYDQYDQLLEVFLLSDMNEPIHIQIT